MAGKAAYGGLRTAESLLYIEEKIPFAREACGKTLRFPLAACLPAEVGVTGKIRRLGLQNSLFGQAHELRRFLLPAVAAFREAACGGTACGEGVTVC